MEGCGPQDSLCWQKKSASCLRRSCRFGGYRGGEAKARAVWARRWKTEQLKSLTRWSPRALQTASLRHLLQCEEGNVPLQNKSVWRWDQLVCCEHPKSEQGETIGSHQLGICFIWNIKCKWPLTQQTERSNEVIQTHTYSLFLTPRYSGGWSAGRCPQLPGTPYGWPAMLW